MKTWSYLLLMICTSCVPNTLEKKSNANNRIGEEIKLPTYAPLPKGVSTLNFGVSGQLRIVNGCVGLNYHSENEIFDILLIFPAGTKLFNQGKAIQFFDSVDKVFYDGNFVITGGDIPSKERPENIDIPHHCKGKNIWLCLICT